MNEQKQRYHPPKVERITVSIPRKVHDVIILYASKKGITIGESIEDLVKIAFNTIMEK
jgi:hypothetical protein